MSHLVSRVTALLARASLASALTLTAALSTGTTGCGPDGLSTGEPTDENDQLDDPEGTGTEEAVPRASGPLRFTRACDPGRRATIAAVGDVLLHSPLQRQAYADQDRSRSLWKPIESLLRQATITYANLEGPAAQGVNGSGSAVRDPGMRFDNVVYTSYPMFNYHPSLIEDLVASGVDVVSTANNHSLDRRSLGIDRTIENLRAQNLPFTGTRRTDEPAAPWHAITEQGGFRVAWIACTFSTNGIADRNRQVLLCYAQADELERQVRTLAADRTIDAVIVTPHWGTEYMHTPDAQQRGLARRLLDAGATAIVGSHPHVLQPWEKYRTSDGREGFIIYSLGNFVSNQSQLPRASTIMLYLGLTRGSDGKTFVNGVRYVPMYMSRPSAGRLVLIPADSATRTGDAAASRTHSLGIFGYWNAMESTERVNTTPECH